jgi:hypothetical protein
MTEQNTADRISVGAKPPAFSLPEIGTGRSIGPDDFLGQPTIIYMWASW